MTRKTTRDAALSRLFGSEDQPDDQESMPSDAISDREGEDHVEDQELVGGVEPSDSGSKEKLGPEVARSTIEPAKEEENEVKPEGDNAEPEEAQSGYIGLGRYAREDGILERITPYVRPDQAEALRVAVARKRDPRGRDISRIIQSLLDEAGYCASAEVSGE
jgi:hypothetical protein